MGRVKPPLLAEPSLGGLSLSAPVRLFLGRGVSAHYWPQAVSALMVHGCNLTPFRTLSDGWLPWLEESQCVPAIASGVPGLVRKKASAGICCAGDSSPWPFVLFTLPPSSQPLATLANQLCGVWTTTLTQGKNPGTEGITGFLNSFFLQKAKWCSNMFLDILGVTLRNSPNMLFSDFQASVVLFLSFRVLNYSLLSLHIPLFFPLIILPIFPSLRHRVCFPPCCIDSSMFFIITMYWFWVYSSVVRQSYTYIVSLIPPC